MPVPTRLMAATLAVCTTLSGCFVGFGVDSASGYAPVHSLTLQRELMIPPTRARTFFQFGQQVAGIDRYEPYCEFEINTVSEQPQVVAKDVFVITRFSQRRVSDEQSGMPAFAWPGNFRCGEDLFWETHMTLYSERQPDVRRLICRRWTRMCDFGGYLAPQGMRAALGDAFVLE